jgi:hypothetical protein
MNKTQFTNRWANMNLSQQELDRKWRLQLEAQEQELMMAEQAVYLASINPMNSLHVGAFGGGTLTPPEPPAPSSPLTVLQYATSQGEEVVWPEDFPLTFTLDPTLPNFSYTLDVSYIPPSQVPTPAALIGVTIGNTVTSIGDLAFTNCFNLASVTFAPISTVTSIGSNAFSTCPSLTSIEIPDSVTSVGGNAFASSGLQTVTISSATAIAIGITSPTVGVNFFGVTVDTILP